MATTYTTSLRLSLQGDNDNNTTWGQVANSVFELIETGIAGISTKAMADANQTLTTVSGAADESRAMILKTTGVLTAIRTVTVPAVSKVYVIWNACTGFAIKVKASGGSQEITVGIGQKAFIFCDGTEVYTAVGAVDVSATNRLIGRTTAGAGPSEEIDITALTNLSAVDGVADHLLIYDASASAFRRVFTKDLKPLESIIVAVSDETTSITTGTVKVRFRMPYAFTLTDVRASLTGSGTTLTTIDINQNGATILSTKLTIDANETTSTTAATPAVISDTTLNDDAYIDIDIDAAGTGANGLKVTLIGYRT